MPEIPLIREAMADLAVPIWNFGTQRNLFRNVKSRIGQIPLFGFETVNRFE